MHKIEAERSLTLALWFVVLISSTFIKFYDFISYIDNNN